MSAPDTVVCLIGDRGQQPIIIGGGPCFIPGGQYRVEVCEVQRSTTAEPECVGGSADDDLFNRATANALRTFIENHAEDEGSLDVFNKRIEAGAPESELTNDSVPMLTERILHHINRRQQP